MQKISQNNIVIAVDPGYDRCGVAIIQKDNKGKEELVFSDCIETNRKDPHPERLLKISSSFVDLIKKYKPTTLAIETLFFNKNITTALKVAEVRGAIISLSGMYSLNIMELSPQAVKIAVTGYGGADKTSVTAMVKRLVKISKVIRRDDEFDAIAIGIACLATNNYPRL